MANKTIYQIAAEETTAVSDTDLFEGQEVSGGVGSNSFKVAFSVIKSTLQTAFASIFIQHSLATAVNDFLAASGAGVFVKKTLAETVTILRTVLDSVYMALISSTDNKVVRFDGAGGQVQDSGITIDDSDNLIGNHGTLYNFEGAINAQTGTTYSTVAGDNGKIITLNNASAITLTIHSAAPAGFNCLIIQKGAGQVTVAAGGTGNVRNYDGHTKLAGQYAMGSIFVESNAGSAPEVYLGGNTSS